MATIKDENYLVIQGWMLTKLHLKGNDLLVYAIIYGFSQGAGHYFNGSLEYLESYTNSTRQGIIKNLNNLVEMGYIRKVVSAPTNKYYALVPEEISPEEKPIVEEKKDKYTEKVEHNNKCEEIISYLNSVCGSEFRSNTDATKKLIKQRFNDGFSVNDFKIVIDCKYQDWGLRPVKFATGQWSNEYLRPSTLFGNKFESYLHEAKARQTSEGSYSSVSAEVDTEVSDKEF